MWVSSGSVPPCTAMYCHVQLCATARDCTAVLHLLLGVCALYVLVVDCWLEAVAVVLQYCTCCWGPVHCMCWLLVGGCSCLQCVAMLLLWYCMYLCTAELYKQMALHALLYCSSACTFVLRNPCAFVLQHCMHLCTVVPRMPLYRCAAHPSCAAFIWVMGGGGVILFHGWPTHSK